MSDRDEIPAESSAQITRSNTMHLPDARMCSHTVTVISCNQSMRSLDNQWFNVMTWQMLDVEVMLRAG